MFLVLVLLSETLPPLSEFVRISEPPPPLTLASDVLCESPLPLTQFSVLDPVHTGLDPFGLDI